MENISLLIFLWASLSPRCGHLSRSEDKDAAIAAVKESGLGLMQAVQAHAKKSADKTEL